MKNLFVVTIVFFFFACENQLDNTVFPTEPQSGITNSLEKPGGNNGKQHDNIIGYCVTVGTDGNFTGDYPMLMLSNGDPGPGKARWPNLFASWYPQGYNPDDIMNEKELEYIDQSWMPQTTAPVYTVISVGTKKNTVAHVDFRFHLANGPYLENYFAESTQPLSATGLNTPETGVIIHVDQDLELYKQTPTGKGKKTTVEQVGWISVGDIYYDNYENCMWPQ